MSYAFTKECMRAMSKQGAFHKIHFPSLTTPYSPSALFCSPHWPTLFGKVLGALLHYKFAQEGLPGSGIFLILTIDHLILYPKNITEYCLLLAEVLNIQFIPKTITSNWLTLTYISTSHQLQCWVHYRMTKIGLT